MRLVTIGFCRRRSCTLLISVVEETRAPQLQRDPVWTSGSPDPCHCSPAGLILLPSLITSGITAGIRIRTMLHIPHWVEIYSHQEHFQDKLHNTASHQINIIPRLSVSSRQFDFKRQIVERVSAPNPTIESGAQVSSNHAYAPYLGTKHHCFSVKPRNHE